MGGMKMTYGIEVLQKQLRVYEENADYSGQVDVLIKLAELFLRSKDLDNSLKHAEKAKNIAVKNLSEMEIFSCSQFLAGLAGKAENYEIAYREYKSLIQNPEAKKEIEMQMNFSYALAYTCWHLSNFEESILHYTNTMEKAKTLKNEKFIAEANTGMGLVNWKQGNYEQALSNYQEALSIHETNGDSSEIARIYNYIAIVYKRQGKLEQAMTSFKHALSIQEMLDDEENMSKLLNNIGNLYLLQSNNKKALDYYLKSLNISEKLHIRRSIASTRNNIGLIYFKMDNFEDAYNFLEKSLQVKKEIGNRVDIAHSLNNLGLVCQKLGKYDLAQEKLAEALQIEEEIGDRCGMATTLSFSGNIAMDKEDYHNAGRLLKKSRQIYEEIGDVMGITSVLINEANIAMHIDNFTGAEEFLLKGLKHAEEIKADILLRDCYRALSELAKEKKDFENAYNYYLKFVEIKDNLSDKESINKIHEMQAKYKLDQQEKEAEIYRLKNVELVEANKELKLLKENLEKRVIETTEENRKKDSLLIAQSRQAAMGEMIGFIAHQWRQPLNSVGVIAQNITDSFIYDELSEEKLIKDTDNIMEQLQFMSQTINDFRNFFKTDKEIVEFDVNDTINRIISFIKKSLSNNAIKLELDLAENCVVKGYPNEYAQVILNIVNNARDALRENENLKDKLVKISSRYINGTSIVEISDNACRIDEKDLPHVFEPYFTTKEEKGGTGLGLYMSKTIIEEHLKGSISVENLSNGVKFIIKV